MADRTITEIEDAVLAKLSSLTTSHGVRQVGPYNGDLDLERFQAAVQQWPAVLAYYAGSSFEDHGQAQCTELKYGERTGLVTYDKTFTPCQERLGDDELRLVLF